MHEFSPRSHELAQSSRRTGSILMPITCHRPSHFEANEKASLCFNDLVLAGDVYLTTGPRGIYRIAAGASRVEPFLDVPNDFLNGFTASVDGKTHH